MMAAVRWRSPVCRPHERGWYLSAHHYRGALVSMLIDQLLPLLATIARLFDQGRHMRRRLLACVRSRKAERPASLSNAQPTWRAIPPGLTCVGHLEYLEVRLRSVVDPIELHLCLRGMTHAMP